MTTRKLTQSEGRLYWEGIAEGMESGEKTGSFCAKMDLCSKLQWLLKKQREVIDTKQSIDAVIILNIMDDVVLANHPMR